MILVRALQASVAVTVAETHGQRTAPEDSMAS